MKKQKEEKLIEHFIRCDCQHAVLVVSKWENDPDVFISIYEYKNRKISFWFKLKYIWRIIRTGTPYGDEFVLNLNKAKKMASVLNEMVEGHKEKK